MYPAYLHRTRYIAYWGRHSGGDELNASPQERPGEPVLLNKYEIFSR